jgi:hypothetical protein
MTGRYPMRYGLQVGVIPGAGTYSLDAGPNIRAVDGGKLDDDLDGKAGEKRDDPTLYEFERTTELVTSGIYGYIRHPMYASLLALAWGAYFQSPSWPGTAVAAIASISLYLTAKADEQECPAYFGEAYADYMQRTRRFIPGVL